MRHWVSASEIKVCYKYFAQIKFHVLKSWYDELIVSHFILCTVNAMLNVYFRYNAKIVNIFKHLRWIHISYNIVMKECVELNSLISPIHNGIFSIFTAISTTNIYSFSSNFIKKGDSPFWRLVKILRLFDIYYFCRLIVWIASISSKFP